jgi:hypothetical protein
MQYSYILNDIHDIIEILFKVALNYHNPSRYYIDKDDLCNEEWLLL